MLKLTLIIAVLVILAMAGGEVMLGAMDIGHVMQENDARLVAAYSIGLGE
jgi:hypothetical protein